MPIHTAIEDVFLQAVQIKSAAERAEWLDEACRGQPEIREEVERLLAAHSRVGDFLEDPPTVIGMMADTARSIPTSAVPPGLLLPAARPDSVGRLAHYEILEVVGRGGMGIVFKAFDEKLERVVAIKAMARALAASETDRRRFVREARSAAAVRHDNVVTIFDVSEANGVPFLVMEFIDGISLQERLDSGGTMDLETVAQIGSQTASALTAAHDQGLVHRDIKPANILLERVAAGTERVKIADFGLARALEDSSLTREGLVSGTPEYMSPEQIRGQQVDHRSDLFSLGSVLYAMCTGKPPFPSHGSLSVVHRIADGEAPPVDQLRPETPPALVALIRHLLSKDPGDRPQSAAEVQALLLRCAECAPRGRLLPRRTPSARVLLIGGLAILVAIALFVARQFGNRLPAPDTAATPQLRVENGDIERQMAQWVQSLGGELMLEVGDDLYRLASDDQLPMEQFHVLRVQLSDRSNLSHGDFEQLGQLKRLRILELDGASVSDDDLIPIGRLPELEDLDVARTGVGDAGVLHLSDMPSLYVLHLFETRITNEALRVIGGNPKLLHLYLSDTEVDDVGIAHLAPLKLLRSLDLRGTRISDRSLSVLGAMSQLEELRLEGTRVTRSAVESLQRQLPNCQIRY